MVYTYYNITDETVFRVLRLHENPYIRKKYLKKIFPISVVNMPNIKKGDIISICQKHLPKKSEIESFNSYTNAFEKYTITEEEYTETHDVIVKNISKNGNIYVKYKSYYDNSFLGEFRRFIKRLKNKLLLKTSYIYTEKDNYNFNKNCKEVDELEKLLGLK